MTKEICDMQSVQLAVIWAHGLERGSAADGTDADGRCRAPHSPGNCTAGSCLKEDVVLSSMRQSWLAASTRFQLESHHILHAAAKAAELKHLKPGVERKRAVMQDMQYPWSLRCCFLFALLVLARSQLTMPGHQRQHKQETTATPNLPGNNLHRKPLLSCTMSAALKFCWCRCSLRVFFSGLSG